MSEFWPLVINNGSKDPAPGIPSDDRFEGPWFQTQTKLKDFFPSEAHLHDPRGFFSWILPTLRTSEFTVLQCVGLDACVLLSFFKMSFFFFLTCALAAAGVLMPFNLKVHGSVDSEPDDDTDDPTKNMTLSALSMLASMRKKPSQPKEPSFLDILTDPTTSLSLHLLFTYLFTVSALFFAYRNFNKFIQNRQLSALELVHSISARTVLIQNIPAWLRGERALSEYFENMGWGVESVSVCRGISPLEDVLETRTKMLMSLEEAWVDFVGNPSVVPRSQYASRAPSPLPSGSRAENMDGSSATAADSVPPSTHQHSDDMESRSGLSAKGKRLEIPGRKRPTVRKGGNNWAFWREKVDAIEYWEEEFVKADEAVRKKRRSGKFKADGAAFVTFESMADAQIAAQVVHASRPDQLLTCQAPEPRDVVWPNVGKSENNRWIRDVLIMTFMAALLIFWQVPVSLLTSLLHYEEIQKWLPWLAKLIDKSEHLRALVQNTLPSMALIGFNAVLPFLLEALCYSQGIQARSWIEYSLLKKYYLFLLISVIFVWNITNTYWALVLDWAGTPTKIPERLAKSLGAGLARNFFMSYVMLQGLGIMPFQLLNIGTVLSLGFYRAFYTKTPRDFAELNAPPMLNYGTVYPQAILVFTVTLMYSVISPLVLVFGAIYFGMGYLVYKYKLLFVFYKPYESSGQAWPITFSRLLLGVMLFQIFMAGLFLLQRAYIISGLMIPLLSLTLVWSFQIYKLYQPLCQSVSLSLIADVQKGESAENVLKVRSERSRMEQAEITRSQCNLNRRRYAVNQEDLYLAPADDRTDYSQPPMSSYFPGVLNTGRKRYAHPALAGVLPFPWLPLKPGESTMSQTEVEQNPSNNDSKQKGSVVLSFGRKVQKLGKKAAGNKRKSFTDGPHEDSGAQLKDRNESLDVNGKRSNTRKSSGTANAQDPSSSAAGNTGKTADRVGLPLDDDERNPWLDNPRQDFLRRNSLGVPGMHYDEDDSDDGSEEPDDETSTLAADENSPLVGDQGRYRPYFPHPERRRAFSTSSAHPSRSTSDPVGPPSGV
ncbi:Uncharacterized conserved protein [Phaffia rhodozyma]|uniref:Uncharacterized conserved protein n=1 Tax=Phaffia rhodozyma TaxID=264483 RepID=A0A0F7SH70_PHARH|nr:Uncharacterized conserved protein [Phaffia rhodozyma]